MLTPGEQTRNESYASELPVRSRKRKEAFEFVQARGAHGATREEIEAGTDLCLSSVCGRVNELIKDGLLIETGERRIGSSGKSHAVVVAKEFEYAQTVTVARCNSGQSLAHSEANRNASTVRSRQPGAENSQGTERRVERVAGHDKGHLVTQKLAALKAERAERPTQLDLF